MKIAIYHNLPHGGALRTVYEQVRALSKTHRIDLYVIRKGRYKDLNDYLHRYYIYEFWLDNNFPGIFRRLISDYRNFISLYFHNKKLAEIIDSRGYDVVLVHSCIWTESPFILKFLKTPHVYHCHELLRIVYEKILEFEGEVPLHKKLYENLTRKLRRNIDRSNAVAANNIITSSDFIRDKVIEVYKKDAITCHTGVDSEIYKPPVGVKKKNQILFIGGKHILKGYELAVECVKLVDKAIRPSLVTLGFGEDVVYVKDDKQLAKIYSESLATICPAREEPFGLAPIESMACETPVLAVNEGGYRETVINGETGYLLKRDPKAFAKKIEYLVRRPVIVRKMGVKARKHVKKNFNWEIHIEQLEKILNDIKCNI